MNSKCRLWRILSLKKRKVCRSDICFTLKFKVDTGNFYYFGKTKYFENDLYRENEAYFSSLKIIAYGAIRHLSRSSIYETGNLDTTASLFDENAKLIDAEEWFLRKDYAALMESSVQEQTQKQLKLVKEILQKVLPDVKEIEISPPNEDNFNPKLIFRTFMGDMRLGELSLGYQSMITWIVDFSAHLFERYPNSSDPIAEPAVVLIDEIDLHLHPKWQREIMGYLTKRFTNTQFIVTAHSPLIVQAAENANIVVLERDGDEVKIKPQKDVIQGWRVDQLLASDLFGEISSRSEEYEKNMTERRKILSKAKLTPKDKNRLEELKVEMGSIPTAETPEDIGAMEIIRRAAKLLEAKQ
ncbi:MAG: AAA family ATPase [Methylococcales bacterium]|nr:AAA family ATPase [Methylococcales bacterium]